MNYCCNIDWLSSYEMVSMLHVFLWGLFFSFMRLRYFNYCIQMVVVFIQSFSCYFTLWEWDTWYALVYQISYLLPSHSFWIQWPLICNSLKGTHLALISLNCLCIFLNFHCNRTERAWKTVLKIVCFCVQQRNIIGLQPIRVNFHLRVN